MLDIKHYVERIYYTKGLDGCNKITEVEEVKKRNPAKVKMENHPNKELVGFRFFDETTILENGETPTPKRFNYSGIVYFGDRINLSTLTEYPQIINNPKTTDFLKNMVIKNISSVCVTADNLLIPMRENDTTTEELYTQKGKTNRL